MGVVQSCFRSSEAGYEPEKCLWDPHCAVKSRQYKRDWIGVTRWPMVNVVSVDHSSQLSVGSDTCSYSSRYQPRLPVDLSTKSPRVMTLVYPAGGSGAFKKHRGRIQGASAYSILELLLDIGKKS